MSSEKDSGNVCFNACTIGDLNFIVIKNGNGEVSEKMMSNDELVDSSINLISSSECCEVMTKYLKGL